MIKRKDLPDVGEKSYWERRNEFMFCFKCDRIIGGTCGDFFMMGMNDEIKCPYCNGELSLCKEERRILVVKD